MHSICDPTLPYVRSLGRYFYVSHLSRLSRWICCGLLLVSICNSTGGYALAQGKGKTQPKGQQPKPSKGKTGPIVVMDDEPAKSVLINPRPIIVPPNEGYLALVTTPKATVNLIGSGKLKVPGKYAASPDGVLKLRRILPGSYRLEIALEGFEKVVKSITISRGEQTVLNEPLISLYGSLELGLGDAVAEDVTVFIDDKSLPQSQQKIEQGKIIVLRAPTGAHKVKLSKPGYEDWSPVQIKPGEVADNKISST